MQLNQEIQANMNFQARLCRYIDTVSTCTVPCMDTSVSCPRCGSNIVNPVKVGITAYRRPLPGSTPSITSKCLSLSTEYKDKDIMNAAIEKCACENNIEISISHADFLKCRAPSVEMNSNTSTKVEMSLLIRGVQVHFWTHSKSCFKVRIV